MTIEEIEKREAEILQNVHSDLITFYLFLKHEYPCNYTIFFGYKNEMYQNLSYEYGESKFKYPDSKHNRTPSLAIDIVFFKYDPLDYSNYIFTEDSIEKLKEIGKIGKRISKWLYIKDKIENEIKWGGDFDPPQYQHWEIDSFYDMYKKEMV